MTHDEKLHSLLGISFYALAFLNMVLLIIVATWAGLGKLWGLHSASWGAAIAFSVFDFLINGAMIAMAFLFPKSEGGGYTPPPQIVVSTGAQ